MDEPVSKSQKKRDAKALQDLGVTLTGLSLEQLDQLPLSQELLNAILEAKQIKSHGARKRQEMLIGKRIRESDPEAILLAWQEMLSDSNAQSAHFHSLEQWRDRLIHESPATLTEFIELYHPEDIQHLRQLVKKARDEINNTKKTGAGKALFRYLRVCIP